MIRKFKEIRDEEAEKIRILYNYHTHNYLCGHAAGTVCDYVREAVKNGMKSIGISDHFAHPALLERKSAFIGGLKSNISPVTTRFTNDFYKAWTI